MRRKKRTPSLSAKHDWERYKNVTEKCLASLDLQLGGPVSLLLLLSLVKRDDGP